MNILKNAINMLCFRKVYESAKTGDEHNAVFDTEKEVCFCVTTIRE